jgi:hypothetical protein
MSCVHADTMIGTSTDSVLTIYKLKVLELPQLIELNDFLFAPNWQQVKEGIFLTSELASVTHYNGYGIVQTRRCRKKKKGGTEPYSDALNVHLMYNDGTLELAVYRLPNMTWYSKGALFAMIIGHFTVFTMACWCTIGFLPNVLYQLAHLLMFIGLYFMYMYKIWPNFKVKPVQPKFNFTKQVPSFKVQSFEEVWVSWQLRGKLKNVNTMKKKKAVKQDDLLEDQVADT